MATRKADQPAAMWNVKGLLVVLAHVAGCCAQSQPWLGKQVVLTGLPEPWDLDVSSNGDLFYTEKCSGLYVLRKGDSEPTFLFGTQGASLVAEDFLCEGQTGANGVTLDPAFGSNRYAYLFMASRSGAEARPWNHIVRLQLAPDLRSVQERTDIVRDIYFKWRATDNGDAGAHSGGRLKFGPDGFLYVTTGDNHNATLPQDLRALGGKVLRVDRDGAAAPGNNAPAGADPRIYAYGFRNVQGIAFKPGTGQAIISEHGPGYDDEVTVLVPGGNGGWDPQNRPGLDCPDSYCGYSGTPATMPMTDTARFPGAMRPLFVYSRDGGRGLAPIDFLVGARWAGWNGELMVGVMGAQELFLLAINGANAATARTDLAGTVAAFTPAQRWRTLRTAPDGTLYMIIENQGTQQGTGQVWRVSPYSFSINNFARYRSRLRATAS